MPFLKIGSHLLASTYHGALTDGLCSAKTLGKPPADKVLRRIWGDVPPQTCCLCLQLLHKNLSEPLSPALLRPHQQKQTREKTDQEGKFRSSRPRLLSQQGKQRGVKSGKRGEQQKRMAPGLQKQRGGRNKVRQATRKESCRTFWGGCNCLILPNACQEAPRVLRGSCQ